MLDIGKLAPGAADYYLAEVATSADDYYTGRGETTGRWVGSIATEMGLRGPVDADHFRRLLAGQDPHSGQFLITSQGSAERAAGRRRHSTAAAQRLDSDPATMVDTIRAASHLRVTERQVRKLLAAGARYDADVALDGNTPKPAGHLRGDKTADGWRVSRAELDRYLATRREMKARPGYDLTLRPPKSVSVLWALAEPEQRAVIRAAHSEAVDEVVRYLEDSAVFARSGSGDRRLVASAGIVAAAFDHRTSRAGDPLLYTHVVTANLTRVDQPGGRAAWRAIAGAGLYEHAKTGGSLYQAHLRHLLHGRLGVRFGPVVNGHAEVEGVPKAVVDLFSKRRNEIRDVLAESGATSPRAAQIATLQTRRAKDYTVDPDTLWATWRTEAAQAGFTIADLAACFHLPADTLTLPKLENVERLFDHLAGPHGLTERASTYARGDVIQALGSALGSQADARAIVRLADRFLASDRALLVDRPERGEPSPNQLDETVENPHHVRRAATQLLWSTPELVHLEQQLLDWADHRSPLPAAVVTASTVAGELAARPELSAEQAAMVNAACTSGEFVQVIAGRPGAGKTYATEAVVAAHVAAGVLIVGCAVSATAASELEQSAGFARSTVPATTVAKLLQDLDHPDSGGLAAGTVVVVDEASMIATRDLHRLAVHAHRAGGRIKLIGDPDQHGAVDVGGVFAHLCSRDPGRVVHLVDNNRQQDHTDRLAIGDYRQGRIGDALDRYDQAGKIVRGRTAGEVYDHMAADWYTAHRNGHADPMIAGPNTTRRALNDRARALLHANGELTGAPLQAGGREFQAGDLVVARRNDRTLRGQAGDEFVKNGSAGTISRIDHDNGAITVRFDREGDIQLPGSYTAAGHLDHGYARTSYGVQGATHDVARYLPEDNASFEEGYVALTRGRTATRIYLIDGAEPAETDTAHGHADRPIANLETIQAALSRRRANLMAADHSPDLADVAQLRGAALLDLADASSRLRSQVGAPPAADSMQAANTNLESALLRRRANLPNDAPGAERELRAAEHQQSHHDAWLQVTADPRAAIDLIGRAANAQLAQLLHGAVAALPTADDAATATGRRHLRQAAGAVAIYHARHQPDIDPDASGPERLLGPRPAPGPARQEYDRASTAIRAAMTNSQGQMLD